MKGCREQFRFPTGRMLRSSPENFWVLRSPPVPPKGTERVNLPVLIKRLVYETSVRYLNASPNYYVCKVPFKHSYSKLSAWHLHLWHKHLLCHSFQHIKAKAPIHCQEQPETQRGEAAGTSHGQLPGQNNVSARTSPGSTGTGRTRWVPEITFSQL